MPQLEDIIKNRSKKKFIKKNYRPWNLSGTETNDNNNSPIVDAPTANSEQQQPLQTVTNTKKDSKKILDNRLDNNKVTIRKQLDNNKIANREQLDSNKVTNKIANREQLDNTLDPSSLRNRIAKTSGFQKKTLNLIVDICIARDSNETGPIETRIISEYIGTTYGSTKTTINRLILKGFIERRAGKTARGGYVNFSIPEEIKDIVICLRKQFDNHRDPIEVINKIRYELDNSIDNKTLVYSSSNITTTNEKNKFLPEEWVNIDYHLLSSIGFSEKQLKQLVTFNTASNVQESINHFSYALDHNKKYKDHANPLNVLMGVLRKGQTWFESAYESPQEKALREMVTRKKAQKEKQESLLKELVDLEFPEWEASLSKGERQEILPKELLTSKIQAPVIAFLRQYFIKTVLMKRLEDEGIFSKK